MIVWGPGSVSSAHTHHCFQLVLSLRGALRIRGDRGRMWIQCGAALVKPDARHEVDAKDTLALIAFVEPESELGAALAERLAHSITPIAASDVNRWRGQLGDPASLTAARVEPWVRQELLGGRKPAKVHPGVRRVLRFLREQIGNSGAWSLETLEEVSGLSRWRLMHVFRESTGVPLRPYILWLRLQRASGELVRGASATEAAHTAGFADAAHMTRTFRRMLGTTPSELASRRQNVGGAFVESA